MSAAIQQSWSFLPEPPPDPELEHDHAAGSPTPPWDASELDKLLTAARRLRTRLAAFRASGGLPGARGRAEPVVLAGLDRHLDAIHGLIGPLLNDPMWVGPVGRKDRRYPRRPGRP